MTFWLAKLAPRNQTKKREGKSQKDIEAAIEEKY